MGLANGKPFKLRPDRFYVDGSPLSAALGLTISELKKTLRARDSDMQRLETGATAGATDLVADLVDKVTVAEGVMLPLDMVSETLSSGDKFRQVTSVRQMALCRSFFDNGIQQQTGPPLHACILLPEGVNSDRTDPTIQVSLIGGHHRVSAVRMFQEMWRARTHFDWNNSSWHVGDGKLRPILGQEVRVSLIYLGSAPSHALLGRVAAALNQLNERAHQTNFHDALTQLHLLGCEGGGLGGLDSYVQSVPYFLHFKPDSQRQYAAAGLAAVSGGHLLRILAPHFDTVLVTEGRNFCSFSRLHQDKTLKNLKEQVNGTGAPIAECLFFALALRFQSKDSDGRLSAKLDDPVKKAVVDSGATLARAKAMLKKSKEDKKTPTAWPEKEGGVGLVDSAMLFLIEDSLSAILGTPPVEGGIPSIDSNSLKKILPEALARAMCAADAENSPTNNKQSPSELNPSKETLELAARLVKEAFDLHHQLLRQFVSSKKSSTTPAAAKAPRPQLPAKHVTKGSKRTVPAPPARNGGLRAALPTTAPNGSDLASGNHPKKSKLNSDTRQVFPFGFVKDQAPWEVRTVGEKGRDKGGVASGVMSSGKGGGAGEGKSVSKSGPRLELGKMTSATEPPPLRGGQGATPRIDRAIMAPTRVLLSSTQPLQVTVAMTTIPEESQKINLIVAGHDASRVEEAASVADGIVQTTRINFPGSVTPDTKVLWMDDEIPPAFDKVRFALQEGKGGGGGSIRECRLLAVLGRGRMKARQEVNPAGPVEVDFERDRDAPLLFGLCFMQASGLSVVLDAKDETLCVDNKGAANPLILSANSMGPICDSQPGWSSHETDPTWDSDHPPRRKWVKTYPGVPALVGALYRSGAVKNGGLVIVLDDPFGAWAEACATVGLPCMAYVGREPTAHIKDRMERTAAPKNMNPAFHEKA